MMKDYIDHIGLSKKLTFLTLAFTLISSFAILACVYFFTFRLNEKFLINELKERQVMIEHSFVEPLWNFDQLQIEEVSKSLIGLNGYGNITAVRVIDSSGNILFQAPVINSSHISFDEYAKRPFTKVGITQIKKANEILGTVQIVFTTEATVENYRGLLFRIFSISCCLICLTCIWIYFFFDKNLTNPLNKLLEHVKQLKNEKYEVREYINISSELQLIGNALNFTSTLINKRNNDLKNHTENLEKLIEERTSELESQIVKNINASRLVAVGEIASDIAHEINNPLMVINGQVFKIKRQLTHVDQEYRESIEQPLEKITLMSERIVKIITGLKLISRDGHGDAMIEFSLPKMIDEIKILTEMKIKSQDIKFTILMPENVGIIHGREVQISQVLVNLINNAVDAVSPLDNKWITLEVSDLDDVIKFAVTDCGNGISTELQIKIMNPFFTTKEVGKGTGLGLSISKGIVKEHGGDFYYNDKVINTQFVFTIRKKSNQLNVA